MRCVYKLIISRTSVVVDGNYIFSVSHITHNTHKSLWNPSSGNCFEMLMRNM